MATAAENLTTSYENACARLAEMDAVPLDERARMSYTEGDKSYGWNEYRAALVAQIKESAEMLKTAQAMAGPFTVTSRVRG